MIISTQLSELKDSFYMNKHVDEHTQPLMSFLLIYLRNTNTPCKGDCMRFSEFSVKHLESTEMVRGTHLGSDAYRAKLDLIEQIITSRKRDELQVSKT